MSRQNLIRSAMLFVCSIVFLAVSSSVAKADLVQMYYSGGTWNQATLGTQNYSTIGGSQAGYSVMASGAAGTNQHYYNNTASAWQVTPLSGTAYTAISSFAGNQTNANSNYDFAAAGPAQLDWYSVNPGTASWQPVVTISTNTYTAVSVDKVDILVGATVYASGPGTGLDQWYSTDSGATWNLSNINANDYVSLSADRTSTYSVFGVQANGDVDWIHYNGSSWQTTSISTGGGYDAVAADGTHGNSILVAKNGELDQIYSTDGWATSNVVPLNSNTYVSLVEDKTLGYTFYGARAGGGVDQIYFDGSSWQTVSINPGTYSMLTTDGAEQYNLYGLTAVPEPSSLVIALLGAACLGLRWRRPQAE